MEELNSIVENLCAVLCDLNMSAKLLSDVWAESEGTVANVLGDPILDKYVDVECQGLAKGYPVLKWIERGQRVFAGGCLKVAKDCASQCNRVNLGFCGEGTAVTQAMACLSEVHNIEFYGRGSPSCSLVEKIRYVYQNHQLFRLNIEHGDFGTYPPFIDDANITVLSLFDRDRPIGGVPLKTYVGNSLLCIDSQNPDNIRQYRSDCTILFATEDEFAASGCTIPDFRAVFLKDGIDGCMISGIHLPALNMNPVDDIGAGDAYLASAAVVLGRYADKYVEAALIGSIAAALHCSEWGNITITRDAINDVLKQACERR